MTDVIRKGLTTHEHRVLTAIYLLVVVRRQAPTYRQIGNLSNKTSLATISKHVRRLADRGYLEHKEFSRSNAIGLTDKGMAALKKPVCPHCGGDL